MTNALAKELIKEYLFTKKSVIYFPNEIDLKIFQNTYMRICQIKGPDNFTKVMKTSVKLIDIRSILSNHSQNT